MKSNKDGERFPRLKIVLEHATTRAAVAAVKSLGSTVGCSITAHHLELIVDDWAGQGFHFCKPVAKYPDDREALREVIREGLELFALTAQSHILISPAGHPRFFLGSDSAPHPIGMKNTSTPIQGCAAGVFTSPILLPLTAHLLESFGALDKLETFASLNGKKFYGLPTEASDNVVTLRRTKGTVVPQNFTLGGNKVVPFMAGKNIDWEVVQE